MEEFYNGADLLIHDGQYTLAEYECGKKGWGHSPIEYVVDAARRASVKRLAICHHDPLRTDSQIDESIAPGKLAGTWRPFLPVKECKLKFPKNIKLPSTIRDLFSHFKLSSLL